MAPRFVVTTTITLSLLVSLAGCVDERDADDDVAEGIHVESTGESESESVGESESESGLESESSSTEGEEPPTCSSTTAVAEAVPPNVMLVLDKSRSMILHSWDDDGSAQTPDVTRWYSLHGTVEQVADHYAASMQLGLTLFPTADATADDGACIVEPEPDLAVGPHDAADLLALMPAADALDIYGATPAAAGISTALAHLRASDDGRPAAMILVTDGAANCSADLEGTDKFAYYDENLPVIVGDAWTIDGIPTYVVGIDIQETSTNPFTTPREKLHEVALAGGVPREGELAFYDARDAEGLQAALDEIAAAVSCTVELGQAPSRPEDLVISIDGVELDWLESCDEGSGWVYVDDSLEHVELCNAACDALLEAGELEAEFLCPPQP